MTTTRSLWPPAEGVEFVNTIAFTPRDRRNLLAILVARSDGDNYGELVLLRTPTGGMTPGPMQVDAQMEQHPSITSAGFRYPHPFYRLEAHLWLGATVFRGRTFVIPVGNTFLYVKSIYLETAANAIPEPMFLMVAHKIDRGDGVRIALRSTFHEALDELFGMTGTGRIRNGDFSN